MERQSGPTSVILDIINSKDDIERLAKRDWAAPFNHRFAEPDVGEVCWERELLTHAFRIKR